MKRRIRKVVNFFAFNLLFFSLYLNFIHKDKPNVVMTPAPVRSVSNTASLNGTVLVSNPEKYTQQKNTDNANSVSTPKTEKNEASKIVVN